MTLRAGALALEQRLATGGVAEGDRAVVKGGHVAEIRDNSGHLAVIELETAHPRARNPVRNQISERLIGPGVPEPAAPQVHTVNRVPVRPVTRDALPRIELCAIRDVGLRILAAVVQSGLPRGELHARRQQDQEHGTRKARVRGTLNLHKPVALPPKR